MTKDNCPTCGSRVKVHVSDEGTGHYEPMENSILEELERVFSVRGRYTSEWVLKRIQSAFNKELR